MNRRFFLSLLFAGVIFLSLVKPDAAVAAPALLPDTAPGKLMAEWVQLFNDAQQKPLAAFIESHYGPTVLRGRQPAEIAAGQLHMRQGTGKLDLAAVEKSSPSELIALFKSDGVLPQFVRVAWKVDEALPPRLLSTMIGPGEPPASALPSKLPIPELSKDLETKLEELTRRDEFSGAALIGKDGVTIWQKAYGLADRERKISVGAGTRFRIGSMNKMFTSVAIAQLVEANKLRLNDTISDVLPDYPNKEIARKVTIHQLLTHTSGLGDFFNARFDQLKDNLDSLADHLPLFVSEPLQFEPGQRMSYSNAGFIVLGLIIEKVSGENYYDYIQHHIYEKAGMKASGDTPKTERSDVVAIGYTKSGGKLHPNWDTLPARGSSAGGGDSTVDDLLKFSIALCTNKLLSPPMTNTITTGKVSPGPGFPGKYAYGFEDNLVAGQRVVGHGGGAEGMNGQLGIVWDSGYTVVVLANLDPPAAENVAGYILQRLP